MSRPWTWRFSSSDPYHRLDFTTPFACVSLQIHTAKAFLIKQKPLLMTTGFHNGLLILHFVAPALSARFTVSVANGTSVLQRLRFPFSCREKREKKKSLAMMPACLPPRRVSLLAGAASAPLCAASALLLPGRNARGGRTAGSPGAVILFPLRCSGFSEESLSEPLLASLVSPSLLTLSALAARRGG